ncbi:MAG: calcium-binding protein, partial [Candidatus Thiodiazotropha sp.]
MVGIIGGENLGLYNGSHGRFGSIGNDEWVGRNGQSDRIYVNTTTGNLVVQRRDEFLTSQGLDLGLLRTYNSLGRFDDANGDNWRLNVYQRLYELTGTVNTAGSSIIKVYDDGAEITFTYDEAQGFYVSTAGEGAHDTLSYEISTGIWRWTDGTPGVEERFNTNGQLIEQRDADGNLLTYTYTGNLITEITDASGQTTYFDYSGTNLTQVRTLSQGQEQSRVRYRYDALNRLSEVEVDLSPEDNSVADGQIAVTQYTYDGDSTRVASITHADGAAVSFTYDAAGRLETLTQNGGITTFTYTDQGGTTQTLTATANQEVLTIVDPYEPIPLYIVQAGDTWESIALTVYGDARAGVALESYFTGWGTLTEGQELPVPDTLSYEVTTETIVNGQTDVEDPLGHITSYIFDAGFISEVRSPAMEGERISHFYSYDEAGNLISATDGNGHVTVYTYDEKGRVLSQRDAEGNTIEYQYSPDGLLLNEIAYLTPDPDGDGAESAADPLITRYVYDNEHHLRFIVSAEGRVEEHRYNGVGQRIASFQFLEGRYAVGALLSSDTLTEADLMSWRGGQNFGQIQRTDYTYDVRGNLSLVTDFAAVDSNGAGVAGTDSTTRYVYDQAGQLLTRIDPRGEASSDPSDYTTHYLYDGLGRLYSTTDALGHATLSQYDDAGSRVITRLANGLTTTQVFDSRGLLISEQQSSPDATPLGTTTYQYDAAGQLRVTTDPTGRKTHMLYDELGRQIAAVDASGALTEYIYDDNDQLVNSIGYATLLTETEMAGLLNPDATPASITLDAIRPQTSTSDRVTANVYDAAGRLIQSIDAEGNVTLNQYDGLSRLTGTEVVDANAASTLELDITVTNESRNASQGDMRQDGTEDADTLTGVVGDDRIYGRGGDDIISGEAGGDWLYGDAGADQVFGGVGHDSLYGGYDNDSLHGDSGNDTLYGDRGDDYLVGGSGRDNLYGGSGDDVYYFERGFGQDTIDNNNQNYDSNSSRTDVIQFGAGIAADQVSIYRSADDLVLFLNDSDDTITVRYYFRTDATSRYVLDEVRFQDGTVWDIETIKLQVQQPSEGNDTLYAYNQATTLNGLGGDDRLHGGSSDDQLAGNAGVDYLYGNAGNDILVGGAGNDYLYGDLGDDRLEGGSGTDYLYGGRGDDTYYFARGFGRDTIDNNYQNYDSNSSRTDVVEFSSDIAATDVFLSQSNNDLHIDLLGTDDRLIVRNYFYSNGTSRYVLDELRFADGTAWSYADVTALLPTMVPPTGQTLDGDDTANILTGGEGDDTLHGHDGNDQLIGNGGVDYLWGENGDDTLQGGVGNDSLYGGAGSDLLEGGSGNDHLQGNAGNDIYRFERGFGQDTITNLDSTAGRIDAIEFGVDIAPNEIRAFRSYSNLVLQLIGTDDLITVSSYFIQDAAGNYVVDEIRFTDTTVWDVDTVKLLVQENTQGNDRLYAYGSGDTLDGAEGDDTLTGADGNDHLIGGAGADELRGDGGNDYLEGGIGGDELHGYTGNDQLIGGTGNDIIHGGADNDTLIGGSGNDLLYGEAGNDIYRFDLGFGHDTIYNNDSNTGKIDVIEFGTGILTTDIRVYRTSTNNLVLDLFGTDNTVTVYNFFNEDAIVDPANSNTYVIEEVRFADGTRWTTDDIKSMVLEPTEFDDQLHGYSGQDNLIRGEGGNDSLYGQEGADALYGGDDNDTLYGRAGDDLLYGERGNDTLRGEAGNDELQGGVGLDVLRGGDGDDNLQGGVSNDTLYGDADNDTLIGDVGNDTLYGGSGSDTYYFERGFGQDTINNSTYSYDAISSRTDVIEFGAGIVSTDISAIRGSNRELYLHLNGTGDRIKVVNYFQSDATTKYAVDEIRFADGTVWDIDTVKTLVQQSTGHNDSLYAYTPGDSLHGAGGNDTLYGENGSDQLWGDAGADTLRGNYGDDTLHGGVGNDTLYGGANNDTLIGDVGNDTLYGGSGSDTYYFERGFGQDTINNSTYSYDAISSRTDVIEFGAGIVSTDISAIRGSNRELYLHLNGTGDRIKVVNYFQSDATTKYAVDEIRFADGTVWDIDTVKTLVQQSTGHNDSLYAYTPGDTLHGAGGDDTLYGEDGNDELHGNIGNDRLWGRAGDDQLLGGVGDDNLYGDADDDILIGDVGNDTLYGGSGSDTYYFDRGFGRDRINNYIYGGSADSVSGRTDVIQFGAGIDPSEAWISEGSSDDLVITLNGTNDRITVTNYFMSNGTSRYVLNQIRFADGTAWNYSDVVARLSTQTLPEGMTLDGTDAVDLLTGGEGNDLLRGYGANDELIGLGGRDTLYGGDGNDQLQGGNASDTLRGDAGDDTLEGGADNDYLYGGSGNDHLTGGLGDDALNGEAGNDIYYFAPGFGQDTISHQYSTDQDEADIVQFAAGIDEQTVRVYRGSSDQLILELADSNDSLTIYAYFRNDGMRDGSGHENKVTEIRFASGTVWTLEDVKARAQLATEANDTLYNYGTGGILHGGGGDDTLYGSSGADHLFGDGQNDRLNGGGGSDQLEGGTGSDTLHGDAGDDTLIGGVGNDTLYGDEGNDIYHFERGFGHDIIYRSYQATIDETDVIRFGAGITAEDIRAYRGYPNNLILELIDTSDQVTVSNFFTNDAIQDPSNHYYHAITQIQFADGTVWSVDDVKARVQQPTEANDSLHSYQVGGPLHGGNGADTLYGHTGGDQLFGGEENDTLYGREGDDRLDGGTGDDYMRGEEGDDTLIGNTGDDRLIGGTGNDTYYFARGFGRDTLHSEHRRNLDEVDVIQFAPDIAEQDIRAYRSSNSLILELIGSNDKITVYGYFNSDAVPDSTDYHQSSIREIRFGDDVIWNTDDVKVRVQQSTDSNDTLYSYDVGNELYGGSGNDTLYGGSGVDYLMGELNDDRIHGGGGDDLLQGGDGGDFLYGDDGDDTLEGGVGNDSLRGNDGHDTLIGGSGNDYLNGYYGDDILLGGEGNDTLYAGSGNDTYRFERGFGHDTLNNYTLNYDTNANRLDVIEFVAGIAPSEVSVGRYNNDLILELIESDDRLTVSNYFQNDGASKYFIDEIRFANGTVWRLSDVYARVGEVTQLQRTTLSWPADASQQDLRVYVSIDDGVFSPLSANEGQYQLVLDDLAQGQHGYRIEYRDAEGTVIRKGGGLFQVHESGIESQVAVLDSVVAQEDYRATRYYYDDDGRLSAELDADGYLTEFHYDGAGRQVEQIRRAESLDVGRLYRSDTVLDDRPLGYWKFDDTEGLVATDVSGNNLDGYYNAAVGLNELGAVSGGGTAISIDGGSNTLVDLGNTPSLQLDRGTVEAWINASSSSYGTIVEKMGAYSLYLYNNELTVSNGTSGIHIRSGVNLVDGQWHHVSMTFDSGVANGTRLYIDGVEVAVGTMTVEDQTSNLRVGGRYVNGGRFTGLIDEVAVFDRVLSADQIRRHADPSGRVSMDNLGQTLTSITPTESDSDQSDYHFYNARGQRIGSLDAQGFLTGYLYDAAGNLIQSTRYSGVVNDYDPAVDSFATLQARAAGAQDRTTATEYDALNRMTAETDVISGNRSEYTYDTVGNRLNETRGLAADGDATEARSRRYRYDLQGRLIGELNGEGSRIYHDGLSDAEVTALYQQYGLSYTYDEAGRRLSATDANGHTSTYLYDPAGRLTHTVNALGEVLEARYNPFGEIEESVLYAQRIDTTGLQGGLASPALLAQIAALADANRDRHITYAYDRLGQQREQIDGEGYATRWAYNAYGELVSQTRTVEQISAENGLTEDRVVTDRYDYNKRGQLTETLRDAYGVQATNRTRYDAFGRVVEQIDGEGNLTATRYEGAGRVILVTDPLGREQRSEFDAFGRTLVQRNGLGQETHYQYDDAQRTLSVTTPEGVTTTTQFNRHGEAVSITDGNGQVTTYEYDLDGQLRFVRQLLADGREVVNESRYDQTGLLIDTLDGSGNRTRYSYDAANRTLARTVDADGLQLTTSYAYDAQGNRVDVTDANGVLTRTQYDRNGRQVSVTVDPNGLNLVTHYETDGDGNVVLMRQGDALDPSRYQTLYRFDGLGRRTQTVVDPEGLALTDSYVYDADGRVVASLDANGNATRFVYDAAGQERYRIDAAGGVTELRYDAAGRMIETIQYVQEIELPEGDYQIGEEQLLSVLQSDATLDRHDYRILDGDGRLVYSLNALGEVTENRYDGNGRVIEQIRYDQAISVNPGMSVADVATALATLGYSDTEWFDAQRSHTVYDALDRVRFSIDAQGYVQEHRYDLNGNRVRTVQYDQAIAYTPGTGENEVAALLDSADPHNRITQFVYDGADRLRYQIDDLGYVVESRYDAVGNLTDTIGYAQAIAPGTAPTIGDIAALLPAAIGVQDRHEHYAYDQANRLVAITDAEGAEERYGLDAAGNRTSLTDRLGHHTRYVYDEAGRQRYTIDAEGSVGERRYDAAGQLIESVRYEQAVDAGGWALAVSEETLASALQADPVVDTHHWYAYDAAGELIYEVDALGYVVEQRRRGQLDEEGGPTAAAIDRTLYDTLTYERPIARDGVMDLAGIRAALEVEGYGSHTWFEYATEGMTRQRTFLDTLDRVYLEIDGEGIVTETAYNALGEIVRTRIYEQRVELSQATSESALRDLLQTNTVFRETEYRYDSLGQLTQTIIDPNSLAITEERRYNAFGEVVHAIDANGNSTRYVYDEMGQLRYTVNAYGDVSEQRYNAAGRVIETIDYTYYSRVNTNGLGDQVSEEQILAYREVHSSDRHTWYTYDRTGREHYRVDIKGGVVESIYDARGNLLEEIAYDRRIDVATEKSNAALAAALQGRGYNGTTWFNSRRTRFFYDAMDRECFRLNSEGLIEEYGYDGRGNRTQRIEYSGTVDYDQTTTQAALDASLNRADPDNRVSWRLYGANNRARFIIDAEGRVTRQQFDNRGNLLTATLLADMDVRALQLTPDQFTVAGLQQAINTYINYDNPLAMWGLDEQSGIVLTDLSGNGRDGVYSSDVSGSVSGDSEVLVGYMTEALTYGDGAMHFREGLSGRVSSAGLQNNHLTLETWVRLPEAPVSGTWTSLISMEESGGWSIGFDSAGQLQFRVHTSQGLQTLNATALETDRTYHVAASFDGSELRLYLNGELAASHTLTSASNIVYANSNPNLTADLLLGAEVNSTNQGTRYQSAVLDDVAIYDRALDAITIARHYEFGGQARVSHYAYDANNRMVRSIDSEGRVVDQFYDQADNLLNSEAYADTINWDPALTTAEQAVTASVDDRSTQYIYDAADRQVRTIDAEGYAVDFAYDAKGNRISKTRYLERDNFTDPVLQQITRYDFDQLNRMVRETDPLGVATRYDYNVFGEVKRKVEAEGNSAARTWDYGYNQLGFLWEETTPEGTVNRYSRNTLGDLTVKREGYGLDNSDGRGRMRELRFSYDTIGRLTSERHADNSITRYSHDAFGQVRQTTEAAGSSDERIISSNYDHVGRLTDQTIAASTPEAVSRHIDYDAFGNKISETEGYGSADARTTRYRYDRRNQLIAETDANGSTVNYAYDAFGNIVTRSVTDRADERVQQTDMTYDARDRLLSESNGEAERIERVYDGADNLRFETRAAGTADAVVTEYRYDLGNRLTTQTVDPSGLALATHYGYDDFGNRISETDPLGRVTTSEYDVMDRVLRTTDAEDFSTDFAYDVFGNQIAITTGQYLGADPDKAAVAMPATTRFAYDQRDRQIYQVDALGVVTRYEYDLRGNRVRQSDAYAEHPTDQAVTEADMTPIAGTDPRVSEYVYNLADQLTDEIQPAGTVVHYTYSGAGDQQSKSVDYGVGDGFINATTQYVYDAGGRLSYEIDPLHRVTRYEYDDFGNVIQVTRGLALDTQGQPSDESTADSRVTRFEYDLANRLTAEIVDPDGLALHTAFEYDARGNQVALTDANGNRGELVYDRADRLIWERNAEGDIVRRQYDANGNLLSETRYANSGAALNLGQLPATHGSDQTTSYTYDANNRLLSRTDPQGVVNQLVYDALGNVLEDIQNATELYDAPPRVTRYHYNLANLKDEETAPNGMVTRYFYDGVYNLTRQEVDNSWQDSLNPDTQGAPTPVSETQVTDYRYDLNNRLVGRTLDPAGLNLETRFLVDALGNTIAETGPNAFAALTSDEAWAQNLRRELGLVDGSGNPLSAASLTPAQQQALLDGLTTRTYYDAAGQAVMTVDPLGHVLEQRYDGVGNRIETIQYANSVSTAGLDALNPPTVTADVGSDRTVTYLYDRANREIGVRYDEVTLADGSTAQPEQTRAYDGVGNVVQEIDANGNAGYNYYDSRGLMIARIDAEGFMVRYTYDPFGNLTEETTYIDRQPLSDTEKAALDLSTYTATGPSQVIEHHYDDGNNRIRTLYPATDLYQNGVESANVRLVVDRGFDAFGNLLHETLMHAQGASQPATTRYSYDIDGRLIRQIDARADELLTLNDAYTIELRRDLGYVDAGGEGKLVAELSAEEIAEIRQAYTTDYDYDAVGNLREERVGDRITTYEYDLVNRNTRVHFPAYAQVEVQANGDISAAHTERPLGEMEYDAFGNLIREVKANGETIRYRYDQANRQIAAIDDMGIYTEYGYNFAGDRVLTHRYFEPLSDLQDGAMPAVHNDDQVIEYEYDRLGRMLSESKLGDPNDTTDDRVSRFGYDANGNTVAATDARGFQSSMAYDGLNRMIRTVTPSGAVTTTDYDGLGNVTNREVGGFDMPSFNSGTFRATPTSSGVMLQWSTNRASNGTVYVRRQGSYQWQTFTDQTQLVTLHNLEIDGLEPNTVYEYYMVAQDAFGYSMTTETRQFTTAAAAENVTVENLTESVGGSSADIRFSLAGTVSGLELLIGTSGSDPESLINPQSFTPVSQGGGDYLVSANFNSATADTLFQLRWTDSAGHRIETRPAGLQQQHALLIFDGEITTEEGDTAGAYDMTVNWNLPPELVQSYPSAAGTRHQVYVDLIDSASDGGSRLQQEAVLDPSGVFTITLENLTDGPRTLQLFYITPEGEMVYTDPLSLNTLYNLDLRYQRLALSFPDLDTGDATLDFRYRLVGSTTWQTIPSAAVNGLSVDMLGVNEGDYEFEAELSLEGEVVRTSSGTFSLREPGQLQNLIDQPLVANAADSENTNLNVNFTVDGAIVSLGYPNLLPLNTGETLSVTATNASGQSANLAFTDSQIDTSVLTPGNYTLRLYKQYYNGTTTTVLNDISADLVVQAPLNHTQDENLLSFTELLPLAANESLSLSVTNRYNQTTSYPFDDATFDVTQLAPGDYTLNIRKSATVGADTVVLHDIVADLIVNPITLTQADQVSLVGSRILTSLNPDGTVTSSGTIDTSGSYVPSEYLHSHYDQMGRKLFSNENGGIWTRYYYDAQGNLTREVQFKYRDPSTGEFVDAIQNLASPSLAQLEANYQAALAAHDSANGVDTIREITRRYDAAGNLLQENRHSDSYGVLTSEWQYDAHGNQVQEITAKGVSGEEQRTRYVYDAMNHLTLVNFGPYTFHDSTGAGHTRVVTQHFTYDSGGNRTTQTNERGHTERYHYDAHNRLMSQWDLGDTLRTDYTYDNFYRVTQKRQTDLLNSRVRDINLAYNHYDELIRITDPLLRETRMSYDAAGNRISETDARGNTEYFNYDGENRVIGRVDRAGQRWTTAYNALGYKLLEIDGDGRTTRYDVGRFGQVHGMT